jgi:hypothetical protein
LTRFSGGEKTEKFMFDERASEENNKFFNDNFAWNGMENH